MRTMWAEFRDVINSYPTGTIFTRKALQEHPKLTELEPGTIDGFRSLLCKAKFMKIIGHGKYEVINEIPQFLTMTDCYTLLKGDNLTYIENLSKRKERNKDKEIFLKERREQILKYIEVTQLSLNFIKNSGYSAYGVSVGQLIQQIYEWKRELSKEPSPTKAWRSKKEKADAKAKEEALAYDSCDRDPDALMRAEIEMDKWDGLR